MQSVILCFAAVRNETLFQTNASNAIYDEIISYQRDSFPKHVNVHGQVLNEGSYEGGSILKKNRNANINMHQRE